MSNTTKSTRNSKSLNIDKSENSQNSFIEFFTKYESLVVFGGLIIAFLITTVLTGIFYAGPIVRDNLLYNAVGAIAMGIGFIYLIFNFMGDNITIMGKTIDFGMVIYICIVLFVMFVLGN